MTQDEPHPMEPHPAEPGPMEPLVTRERRADLRMFRHFAQGVPPLVEAAGAAVMHFSLEATQLVDALALNPDASPRELLLLAGEARARLEAAQGEFDMALHHLSRLPVRIDLKIIEARPATVRVPEVEREPLDDEAPAPEEGAQGVGDKPGAPGA